MSWRAKYTIVEYRGEGGYGTVWAARDRAGRLYAIKLLRECAHDFVRALYEEATKLYDLLGAPGVVQLVDHDLNADEPYIVVELAERSLLDRLGGQPQPPALAAAIGLQLVCAVRQTHARNVLHLDIKPDNLLLIGGLLKLADFGLAKGVASLLLTVGGRGTPGYMAPEQALGQLSPAADAYGIGATLYHVLTGQRPPHDRTGLDPRWLAYCPPDLAMLVQSMTSTRPEHRPPLEAVEDFLRRYLAPPAALPPRQVLVRRQPVRTGRGAEPLVLGGFVLAAVALLVGTSSGSK
jgi:serine/threonine protein kinase